jgi:hypothetical protein
MSGEVGELAAVVDAGPEVDDEQAFDLAQRLRGELLELDLDAVEPLSAGAAPEGAKAIEALAIGGLLIKGVLNSSLLRSVVTVTTAWLGRQQARSVKLTLGGDTLELTGVSSEEQSRLVDQWIAHHAVDG